MLSFTLITIVALLATIALADPTFASGKFFQLKTRLIHRNDNVNTTVFDKLYLATYPTGPGENVAVAIAGNETAATVTRSTKRMIGIRQHNATTGDTTYLNMAILLTGPQQYDSEGQDVGPAAPKGYRTLALDLNHTAGSHAFDRYHHFGGYFYNFGGRDWKTWAVCSVVDSLGGNGTGYQILWRAKHSKPDTTGQCADVHLFQVNEH